MNFSLLEKYVNRSKLGKARIAELSGISRTTLDSAINGADIKISTLERIANAIGVNASIFFDCTEESGVTITNGSAAAVNVHAPINAPITASSSDHAQIEALTAELAHANALLESTRQILSEREQLIKEKERLIQLLLKQ